MLCCGVVCAVWCVVCVRPQRPRVYRHHAHMLKHMRAVVPAYTETFKNDTRGAWVEGKGLSSASCFSSEKIVIFEHVERHLNPMSGSCLIANFLLTKIGSRRVITCSRG